MQANLNLDDPLLLDDNPPRNVRRKLPVGQVRATMVADWNELIIENGGDALRFATTQLEAIKVLHLEPEEGEECPNWEHFIGLLHMIARPAAPVYYSERDRRAG